MCTLKYNIGVHEILHVSLLNELYTDSTYMCALNTIMSYRRTHKKYYQFCTKYDINNSTLNVPLYYGCNNTTYPLFKP